MVNNPLAVSFRLARRAFRLTAIGLFSTRRSKETATSLLFLQTAARCGA